MKTKYPLLWIFAAVISPAMFPVSGFSQAPFYQGKTIKIVNNDPGGVVSLRVKTVSKYLSQYIPGNPTIIVEIIDGGGGRRAANHVFQNAKPDGLTIGALSGSVVGLQVMRGPGVMYDIDKFIHVGTPISENHNVIYTRSQLGLNSLEKLRAASGLKLGAQEVGGAAYISARLFAYFLNLKTPRFVTGYSALEADVALNNGEIDSRSNNATSVLTRNRDWIDKGIMDFHAILAVPKSERPAHPKLAQLPEIETFAKTDKERKLLSMWRSFRTASMPWVLPPGTPKDRVEIVENAMRRTFADSEFRAEFKKVITDDASPWMPEELTRIIREMPRDLEVIDMLKGSPDQSRCRRGSSGAPAQSGFRRCAAHPSGFNQQLAPMTQLDGKVALITGAGRGIGKAIALGFARAGADVIAAARTLAQVEDTAREVKTLGRRGLAIAADVSRFDDVRSLAERVQQDFGALDILVNNAALRMNHLGKKDSYLIPFTELSVEDWDSAINVNLRGPFLCIRELLPAMRRNGGGSIINMSAGGGKRGMAGRSPYCASKFGLEGLTQSLALEFRSLNIAVNSLSPGKHSIFTDEEKREQHDADPQRIFMRPEMMVPPAVFLALQNGAGVTGRHLEALEWINQNGLGTLEDWKFRL